MNIILIGPPGAGKGTISEWLKTEYQLDYLSTGDLFRDEIIKESELGRLAKSLIDKGEFIPDELTCDIVFNHIQEKEGYLLDGFPRTLFQAKEFTEYNEAKGKVIDYIFYFNLSDEVIKKRLVGRRVCPDCKSIYHIDNHPPLKAGECDKCGGKLEQRKDDKEEFIQKRLDIYKSVTVPVVQYYKTNYSNKFVFFESDRGIEEIKKEIQKSME